MDFLSIADRLVSIALILLIFVAGGGTAVLGL